MHKVYINRWTLSILIVIIGTIIYFVGYPLAALIGAPIVISFIVMNAAYKNPEALSVAFLSGAVLSLSLLTNWYAAIALLPLTIYMFGPIKATSIKILWSLLFGLVATQWLYLPIYLYMNYKTIADSVLRLDLTDLTRIF